MLKPTLHCRGCEAPVRILPGQTFGLGDAQQFEQLERAFHEANLSPALLAFIARAFAVRSGSAPGEVLRSVTAAIPALAIFELLIEPSRAAESKAERMLAVMVHGLNRLG